MSYVNVNKDKFKHDVNTCMLSVTMGHRQKVMRRLIRVYSLPKR